MFDFSQKDDQQVAGLLKALGKAYLENGENQKASEKFRQLVNNGIVDPEILLNFALSLVRVESTNDEALAIYRNAVAAEENNETLYLSLSTLFLKKNITDEPALKIFRRSLKFSPPMQDEIRAALEKIFHETTDTITTPELRKTLLDGIDNPDILKLYLSTVWNDAKYDEAIYLLKDLYNQSNKNSIYLKAICHTLLEKRAQANEHGLNFNITASDVEYCSKYRNINKPINRINEIELYLDLKNLFLSLSRQAYKPKPSNKDEFEFFILNRTVNSLDENTELNNTLFEIDPVFSIVKDLFKKKNIKSSANVKALQNHQQTVENNPSNMPDSDNLLNRLNTLAIFEICNFDSNPANSKLPFTTFINLISGELLKSKEIVICATEDGLFTFGANPNKLLKTAVETLQKLDRYNQVVEKSEIIHLHVSLHYSEIPFLSLQNEGLKEIRKGFKVHNISKNAEHINKSNHSDGHCLYTTEPIVNNIKGYLVNRLGEKRLAHFPHKHQIYELFFKRPAKKHSNKSTPNFGKYKVSETIKENQLCSTYRGYDSQLERPVIIKAYRSKAFSDFKEFTHLRKQFYEEVRKLNRISHPNIGVIYDAGDNGEILYLVREYSDGWKLHDYLRQNGLPDIHKTLDLYIRICKILALYHSDQIWHKNLKPDNIFVTKYEEIKLTDGGLLQVRNRNEIYKDDMNTLAYSSPEQIQGLKLSQSCDIFQLGIMLYESLTGVHPCRGNSASEIRIKILADVPVLASKIRHDVSADLDAILTKALAKKPEKRYKSIQSFVRDIQKLYRDPREATSKRLY